MENLLDNVDYVQDQHQHQQLAPLSQSIRGIRGRSTVFIDELGFNYYQHSIRREIRYLTCVNRRYGCPVSAIMNIADGSPIHISNNYAHHNHEPAPRYTVAHRNMINRLRERATTENTVAQTIVDEEMLLVNTICMDGTFQVRPREPADINQIFTIQIIVNNVAIPIVHALLVNRQTETYCRLLQFLRQELHLNLDYNNIQVITDYEQGLRNAITRVLPEANNSGCWFHFIQAIIRFVRTHHLTQICTTNENARRILRMLMALPHLPGNEIMFHENVYSIQLGFRFIQDLVADYNLEMDLAILMTYFERFWMDQVTPLRFTVYRLQHRTNNFIESYHSSLLRLMGQRPPLYRFYDNLRTIELRARNDFTRALNGQRVRQSDYRIYPQNNTTINNAWFNVENGRYSLEDFLRNVSYTQILRNELGEPNFEPRPATNVQPLPPPQLPQPLILGPLRPPSPLPVLPVKNRAIHIRGR
ncbi:RING-type domain-containing protein, partial [Aphis craccivora]